MQCTLCVILFHLSFHVGIHDIVEPCMHSKVGLNISKPNLCFKKYDLHSNPNPSSAPSRRTAAFSRRSWVRVHLSLCWWWLAMSAWRHLLIGFSVRTLCVSCSWFAICLRAAAPPSTVMNVLFICQCCVCLSCVVAPVGSPQSFTLHRRNKKN